MDNRIALALALSLSACAADPDHSTDAAPTEEERPYNCTRDRVDTVLWVRFWSADGQELSCHDVSEQGYVIEHGALGQPGTAAATMTLCQGIGADPGRRYFTAVATFKVGRYEQSGVHLVDSSGAPASVETWISHTPNECMFGVAERQVSFVLR
jgi:hypothetical protein